MKTIEEGMDEAYLKNKPYTSFNNGFYAGVDFAKKNKMPDVLLLKKYVVQKLLQDKENLDSPYLVISTSTFTRKELAKEIESDTEFGIEFLSKMVMLVIDRVARDV